MKFLILLACVAIARAGYVAPVLTGSSTQHRSQDILGNYAFGYQEGHATGGTFRQEAGDKYGNKVGSYGLTDADGRVRTVKYVADALGFRAAINTNEPGTAAGGSAAAVVNGPIAVKAVAPVAAVATAPIAAVAAPAVVAGPALATSYGVSVAHAAPAKVLAAPGIAAGIAGPLAAGIAAPINIAGAAHAVAHAAPAKVLAAPAVVGGYGVGLGYGGIAGYGGLAGYGGYGAY